MPDETSMKKARWLFLVTVMIIAMVVLGGLVRLTRSGLSIVEWNVITGVIPPIGQEAWDDLDGPACAHWTNVHDRIALAAREQDVGVGNRRAAVAMAATAGAEIPGTGIMRRYKAVQSRTWREGGLQWLPPQPSLRWW